MSTYKKIANLGRNMISPVDNPLTYCINAEIDNQFLHGSSAIQIDGMHSKKCQQYMSEYCANNFDQFCQVLSKNTKAYFPNNTDETMGAQDSACLNLNAGEILIHNTAKRKYLHGMYNCVRKFEPFDPTVANSPMISYWVPSNETYSQNCVPIYTVDPKTIDDDIVMDKFYKDP